PGAEAVTLRRPQYSQTVVRLVCLIAELAYGVARDTAHGCADCGCYIRVRYWPSGCASKTHPSEIRRRTRCSSCQGQPTLRARQIHSSYTDSRTVRSLGPPKVWRGAFSICSSKLLAG